MKPQHVVNATVVLSSERVGETVVVDRIEPERDFFVMSGFRVVLVLGEERFSSGDY